MTDYARDLFKQYREVQAKVLEWQAVASERRAEVANRYRNVKKVELGSMVVYRNPKACLWYTTDSTVEKKSVTIDGLPNI